MQSRKKTKENEREKLFQVKRKRSVLKKSLTEPALLEMSGKDLSGLESSSRKTRLFLVLASLLVGRVLFAVLSRLGGDTPPEEM